MTRLPPALASLVRAALLVGPLALGAACSSEPEPEPGCTSHDQCAEGELCAEDGSCVPGAECTSDKECPDARQLCNSAFECVFREGFGDECDTLRPCAFGEFCSPLLGRCLPTVSARDCIRRSQCPAGQLCDKTVNKCVTDLGCYGDEFCDEEEVCDLDNRICRAITVECTPCALGTMTCDGGALCELETKECVAGGTEPVCRTGEFCDVLGRCVQCSTNDQCGPGLYCNSALGRCDSNTQCAPDPSLCPESNNVMCVLCPPPQMCNVATKRCEAPAIECESDVDCPGDQFCDLDLPVPICVATIPDCLNDLLEGNNNRIAGATLLAKDAGPLFDELKLCPGDVDWYRIDVEAGTYLTVDARFEHSQGDIDLQLFLPDGSTLVNQSRSTTDNERLALEVGTTRSLLVKVFLSIPNVQPVAYRLIVAHDPGDICQDDANEPDDTIDMAKDLVSDRPYEGRLCSADPDWFALRGVPAGSRVNVALDFVDSLGDLDLQVYRSGSPAPILEATSMDDDERLSFDASFAGDYFLRVYGKAADTNVYTLRADLRSAPGAICLDDRFEPNNSSGQATRAPDATGEVAPDLSICAGDQDWYVINLGPGEAVRASVGFDPGADLELKLYAPGATSSTTAPIRASSGVSAREFVGYRATNPGDYLLRVHGRTQQQLSPYELRINRDPPFICEPDIVDQQARGTSMADAFPLPVAPSRLDDLTICSGDEDWYELSLPAGFRHAMRIEYLDADATLDFAITDFNGGLLAQTAGAGFDVKEVAGNVPGVGGIATLFMRVFRSGGGFETRYSVVIDSTPLPLCNDDVFEPNDIAQLATQVATSSAAPVRFDNTLCSQTISFVTGRGDEDWFILNPVEGMRMEAVLDHDSGDLFLELRSPGGEVRACPNIGGNRCFSDGLGLDESLTFTATTAAPYFVRVGSIYGDPQVQVRPTDADTPYRLTFSFSGP